ncbi:NAD-dependent protein deacylase sirtuin-5, mitochondrial [Plakobranchus ocellatus]|uniref:NAD-dependent protein deacylase sirtuin-5, mitochondrial n=1 Tax=Plakobranchus ocellatus TaxID=259542 RepID=A0AAV4DRX5_9GAST|nr:NAD-dependent protein deacylase sirtuin-5, mitochondrial [Plakobranchus ocellatus]
MHGFHLEMSKNLKAGVQGSADSVGSKNSPGCDDDEKDEDKVEEEEEEDKVEERVKGAEADERKGSNDDDGSLADDVVALYMAMMVALKMMMVGTSSVVYPAAMFAPQVAFRGVPVAEFNIEETPATSSFG